MNTTSILSQLKAGAGAMLLLAACSSGTTHDQQTTMKFTGAPGEVKLITLDPGHFHAALVQKSMYDQVDPTVYVYAPEGPDVSDHLERIEGFNTRAEAPTRWEEIVYEGPDFLEKMIAEKPGNVVVISGNNQRKTEYILDAVNAGLNVLADKPMAIDVKEFEGLKQAFADADQKGVLLYDIMTERFEITTQLQKALSMVPAVFGELQEGSAEAPAVTKESVHHFFKYVSGNKIKRPAWFFDVLQQGEGIVDVTTHLVDLVQWECFPEQTIDYQRDIELVSARHWTTELTSEQFNTVTRLEAYPDYLRKDVDAKGNLQTYSNGEIVYKLKGKYAKVSVIWNYQAPEGAGDTHFSIMRGGKANLIIRQGADQNYRPELYIEPAEGLQADDIEPEVAKAIRDLQSRYPGIEYSRQDDAIEGDGWHVLIPDVYHNGHEAHFGQVTERYLQYLTEGKMPAWEVPNMIAKYYTTTRALELAKAGK
jgi:predicted dehydrogenase